VTLVARTDTSVELPLGQPWRIAVRATDEDGLAVADVVVVTVTPPTGPAATPTVEELQPGYYDTWYTPAAAGRHTARAVGAYGAVDFVAYVAAAVTAGGMPTIADLKTYLGTHSFTDPVLQAVMDAEASAQRRCCRVPAAYPADLREALLRRCARNLAMRRTPTGVMQGDGDGGNTRLSRNDPEIRRLEAPYPRLKVG
jgi:hypothetical protein